MVSNILKLVLCLFVLSTLHLTSSAQKCKEYKFPNNKVYANCSDLPYLSSFLHWTYSKGILEVAYRRIGITSNRWVSWALNPNNKINKAMIGAQAFVAILQSNGSIKAYTTVIEGGYNTHLEMGDVFYPGGENNIRVTYQNNEVVIYTEVSIIPVGSKFVVHTWQDGPLLGSIPQRHDLAYANLHSKGVLNLV
jgi:hypothetical protein